MSPDDDGPLTPFEEAIVRAQRGETGLAPVLDAFEQSRILVPSRTDSPDGDLGGIDPLVFEAPPGKMLVAVSHPSRLTEFVPMAPFALEVWGADLVMMTPRGAGIIVNPRHEIGLELVPSLIDILRQRRGRHVAQDALRNQSDVDE